MPELLPTDESAFAEETQAIRGTAVFRRQMEHISLQASAFFAGTLFVAAITYFFKVYLARVLGAEALGVYALGMTMVGFLSVFNAVGLPQAALRFVAVYSASGRVKLLRGFLARSLCLLSISSFLLAGVLPAAGRWTAIHLYHNFSLGSYIGLFAIIMVCGTLNAFLGQVLGGYKEVSKRTVITNFVGTPAMMILTVLFVTWGMGLRGYISAQIVGAVFTTLLLGAVVWRLTPRMASSAAVWQMRFEPEVVAFSLASFGVVFLEFLMAQADKILVGVYMNAREVGIYAVAMGLVAFVPSVLQAVNQIFAPTIAELHARADHQVLRRIFQTLTKWVLGLTLPLILVLLLFAHPLMRIFGGDFEAGWSVLVIGTLGELVDCGVGSVGFLLLMSGNERPLLRIQIVMGAAIVCMNLLLIPRWGIAGAAAASAMTTILTNLWCLKNVHRILGLFPYTRSYYRLIAPVTASFVVLWLGRILFNSFQPGVVIAASLILAYAAFGGVAWLLGMDADDQLIAGAVWARLRAAVPGAR
jgi:O-antigen/teichoic acid export membrane protein